MDEKSLSFLRELLETPSPPGYESPVQTVVRRWAGRYADEVRTDLHGNVIAVLNPGGSPRILLDGHCDQIALMVKHIDELGFLYCQPMGGWDPQVLVAQGVTVWTEEGPVAGVIGRKARHLLTPEELRKVPKIHDLWIDIGVESTAEASSLVSIGDPVTLVLGMRSLPGDLITGPKMDDSTGVFTVFEALRRLHGESFAPALYVVSAVQEEVGMRGAQTAASGVRPTVGIAVDVTHATDSPNVNPNEHGLVRLGGGPVLHRGPNINPVLYRRLKECATQREIPIQISGAQRGLPNDTNPIQLSGTGVATACIGIPNRYMHTPVEIVSLADLDRGAELLRELVLSVEADTDFTP